MKNLLCLFGFIILLVSCGKSEDLPVDSSFPEKKESVPMTIEEYYKRYTFGYKVKDTSNLKSISMNVLYQDPSTALLSGLRDSMIWIGKFDIETKEQIEDYTDAIKFNDMIKIELGYGEHEDIHIHSIVPTQFLSTEASKIIVYLLKGNSNNYRQSIIFASKDTTRHYIDNNNSILLPWYNGSFAMRNYIDRRGYIVYDKNGAEITRFRAWLDIDDRIPVSYTEFIDVSIFSEKGVSIYRSGFGDYTVPPSKWNTIIDILKGDSRSKCQMSVINHTEDIYKLRIDVTEYSGEKHSHAIEINVSNGEVLSIDELT